MFSNCFWSVHLSVCSFAPFLRLQLQLSSLQRASISLIFVYLWKPVRENFMNKHLTYCKVQFFYDMVCFWPTLLSVGVFLMARPWWRHRCHVVCLDQWIVKGISSGIALVLVNVNIINQSPESISQWDYYYGIMTANHRTVFHNGTIIMTTNQRAQI